MNLETASRIANDLCRRLEPACEQLQIAGGIRRRKTEPHDIELVAIPRFTPVDDLFGDTRGQVNLLDVCLVDMLDNGFLQPGPKNGPRMKQFKVPQSGIMVDLFVVLPPAQWGVIYAIRTGPAHYSHWLVTQQAKGGPLPDDAYVQDGTVWYDGQPLPMPTEASFFAFLGMQVPDPAQRHPAWNRVNAES